MYVAFLKLQAANRLHFMREHAAMLNDYYVNSGWVVGIFSPCCVVVPGSTDALQTDRTRMGSFENFRACDATHIR
ncbi:hypothetical protein AUL39_08295 [Tractidigestivibacter scatoligenes]|uniref:Uncharacterized protein n=1 Tax=Tractidigestivibacter scatoligenes TaxID=1299998 RepID=A0A100YVJ1_TRASO|nr:hypothetical protein AUL39_08295 [Tractidigestivibacter scatoligenes]